MNRFIQTILIVFLATFTAFCQERDSVVVVPDSALVEQDSVYRFEDIDSIYSAMDPDLYAARRLAADSLSADTLMLDSLALVEAPVVKSPTKALMFALVLPGLGQVYNRKYWKVPIVWGAMGLAGYAIAYNTKQYKAASNEFAQNPEDSRELEWWRRNMELSYIAVMAIYALQVLDAYVDAQLYSWDVNDNLSLRVSPSLQPLLAPNSLTGQSYGLTCSFNIRGR
jgi:hypothetical protein